MKGYKAFNKDLTCRGMQYKVGEIYEMDGLPSCCDRGFHFCKEIADVYNFYPTTDETRICEVEALGEIDTDDDVKFCTNKIKIVKEIRSKKIKHCNVDKSEVGFLNSGNYNSGNKNSGYYNSGNRNSGDCNSGNRNSGYGNSGYRNSGDYNSGYYNSGNKNSGYGNSGYRNSGDYNSGDCNSGNRNSGYGNSGDYNSGYYNSGDYNSGYCNTTTPTVRLFNKDSGLTFDSEIINRFKNIMYTMSSDYTTTEFIIESTMTDEEKKNHPEYKTIGGYLKTRKVTFDKWLWWNEKVSEEDKEFIRSLPNYDEDVFFESTGIKRKE